MFGPLLAADPIFLLFISSPLLALNAFIGLIYIIGFIARLRHTAWHKKQPHINAVYTFSMATHNFYKKAMTDKTPVENMNFFVKRVYKSLDYTKFQPGDKVKYVVRRSRKGGGYFPLLGTVISAEGDILKVSGGCAIYPDGRYMPDKAQYNNGSYYMRAALKPDSNITIFNAKTKRMFTQGMDVDFIGLGGL